MTEQQIILVKKTWRLFREIDATIVGDAFYSKLFKDHPALRKLFPKDMVLQYRELVDMLNMIVARLDKPEELNDDILKIAQRYIGFAVKPIHFAWIGTTLVWTLRQGLGIDWTEEVGKAWTDCYASIADTILNSFSSAITR